MLFQEVISLQSNNSHVISGSNFMVLFPVSLTSSSTDCSKKDQNLEQETRELDSEGKK